MWIYELDLHFVLCRPYVFVLLLTYKTDDSRKCHLHQPFQVKKYHPCLFQYICVNHIVKISFKTTLIANLNAILYTVHELFCAGIVFKKMYVYVFMSENAERFTYV